MLNEAADGRPDEIVEAFEFRVGTDDLRDT